MNNVRRGKANAQFRTKKSGPRADDGKSDENKENKPVLWTYFRGAIKGINPQGKPWTRS
jgi:hypothetical protein